MTGLGGRAAGPAGRGADAAAGDSEAGEALELLVDDAAATGGGGGVLVAADEPLWAASRASTAAFFSAS